MKQFWLGIIAMAAIMAPVAAHAHVLIADQPGKNGAVLHVEPDDNPVAGEPAKLFVDLDEDITANSHSFGFTVAQSGGAKAAIPLHAEGHTIEADYTFPAAGDYEIVLSADPVAAGGTAHTFTYAQHVSAATSGSTGWATLVLAGGLAALAIGVAMLVRARRRG